MKRTLKKAALLALVVILMSWALLSVLIRPSLNKDWTKDQAILSHTVFNADGTISISNIRNIDYQSTSTYVTNYYDGNFNPDDIVRAWFMVEPFGSLNAAHTLVSFEFKDGRYLSISSEIRKEKGESFSPLKGLLRQYEMVYVVADERDVIRLRTNYRKDQVRLYPIRGNNEKVKEIFIDMLKRANKLAEDPEMYNTLTNNCTTNIISHVREFSDKPIPWWDFRYLFPATIDTLAYDKGLIDTNLPLVDARAYYLITEKAQAYDDDPDFSRKIRVPIK
jgi:hypothetical protein